MYGVHRSTVQGWFKAENIPTFTMAESAKIRMERSMKVRGRDVEQKEEPYLLLDTSMMIELEEDGRLTRVW